ncbi:protein draper-like isoform X2 [Mercenaria mercenaria]|uniref:protein draper-like isoform X2 n=1 Tax=Mercenaria mercenaria TaxID=6596 RepID=UPI00234F0BA7|nr:protein draper-like isoform X2 [Mercenaria mercenaria]
MLPVMTWILLLLLSMICPISSEEQCLNKPCACCRTDNCDSNSTCENGCIDGYWGDNCYYSCPVHCVKCEQDRPYVCDKCHDGFHNGYWHDGKSHGPWTDNCTNICSSQCKSCFNYQHCKECVDGYYKTRTVQNCTLQCPQRCVSCLSELDCTECKPGYFGRKCSQLCSKGCNSLTCDKKTGRCNCTSHYMGDTCKYCKHDIYRTDCDLDCPENCFVCNQSDNCLFCKQGYEGPLCTQPNSTTPQADNHTLGIALGTVFGAVSVVLLALVLLFGWRRQQRGRKERVSEASFQNAVSRSPELQRDISKISGKIDMEMSVDDEIPGWSTMNDVYTVPNGLDDSDENRSGEYSVAVDTSFTNNNVQSSELGDRSSNYSFAIDPINEKEKKVEDISSSYGKDLNVKGEPDCNIEKLSKDNPAFEMEESAKEKYTCETIDADDFNIEKDKASYAKKTDKKRPKKGFKSEADYEKIITGKLNEHIYNEDNGEHKINIENMKNENFAPDTPGYEKTINFKTRTFYEKGGNAKHFETCEKDKNKSFENEKVITEKQGCDEETDVEDNLSFEKKTSCKRKGLQSTDDYEELQKIKNNEHDYEEGVIQLPDYTNVDNKAQSSATFGVFRLV